MALDDLARLPHRPGQYLVEITAFAGGEGRSGGIATIAEIPLADLPKGGAVTGIEAVFRYADRHWAGEPTDPSMANVFYEGRVTVPLVMERQMPLLPEEERRVQRQLGNIEIHNADGALDELVTYAVDGRAVRVLFGPAGGAYGDFTVIANVLATGWEADDIIARVLLRDLSFALDQPLQRTLYAGTGGDEGGEEVKGKPKPLCFGRARNITPVLIDPARLIYQWHDGAGLAVDGVYDRAAALTASGSDVADYAALAAATVPAGNYTTANAVSMFRLGSTPAGLVTADVRGDANPSYVDAIDTIALRVLTARAGLRSSLIDTATWAALGAAAPGEMGIYIGEQETPTTNDVINRLVGSVGGWWGASRAGLLRAGRLMDPADETAALPLDQYDILTLEPEATPIPRWRQRVAYRPNWTPQQTDIAPGVTPERRQFLVGPERVEPATDETVRTRRLGADDPPPLTSFYDAAADAQALAAALLALYSPDRRIFRATVKRLGYLLDLGQCISVTWPRLGLGAGRNFIVIGIREEADRDETVLRLWG